MLSTDLDILEKGVRDENLEAFEKFALWVSLPISIFSQFPDDDVNKMLGIDDPDVLEMIAIPSMKAFSEKYGISQNTLTAWRKKIRERNPLHETKKWVSGLAKNMMLALYNRAIRSGDAAMIKLFFQVATDWSEKATVDHNYKGVTEFVFKLTNGQSDKNTSGAIAEAGRSPAVPTGQGN